MGGFPKSKLNSRLSAVTDVFMFHGTPRTEATMLERQLLFLSGLFEVVPLERIGEPGGRRRRVALTFDDGLRSNVTVAYPILRKLRIPATFYVCPELIERRRWLWNHEMRARLATLEKGAFMALANYVGAPQEREAFIAWMKRLDLASRRPVEQAVRRATRWFVGSLEQHEAYDLASWDELARLDPAIVTIGSHTLSHSILTSLTEPEMEREIRESRSFIEQRLQRPAEHFCYPNGDFTPAALKLVRQTYRTAVTTEPGQMPAACDLHLIPRWPCQPTLLKTARLLYSPGTQGALGRWRQRTVGTVGAGMRMLSWMVSRA